MIHVLCVDDEPSLCDIIKIILEKNSHFKVDTALSAHEGLQKLNEGKYDAIVSDYQMPGMDGIELLKIVRTQYPTLPFIIFTGRGREKAAIDALNNGADFYLQKGIETMAQFAELRNMVETAVKRRQAEEALKESEEKYRILAEKAPIGILTCDREGQITYLNPKVVQILGSPGEEKTREINLLQFPPLIEVGFSEALQKTLETGVPIQSLNAEYTSKWGRTAYFRVYISPLVRNGSIHGAQVMLDDITHQKNLEDALRNSEKLSREIIEHLPHPTFVVNTQREVIVWNRAMEEMTGVPAAEMIGQNDRKDSVDLRRRTVLVDYLLSKDDEILKKYFNINQDGKCIVAETPVIPFMNRDLAFWVKASPLFDGDGELIGAIETVRIISEITRSE